MSMGGRGEEVQGHQRRAGLGGSAVALGRIRGLGLARACCCG